MSPSNTPATSSTRGPHRSAGGSYWQRVGRNFRQNRLAMGAAVLVGLLVLTALCADFIAYNKPYYAVYDGKTYYPVFYDYAESLGLYEWEGKMNQVIWRELDLERAIWPPVSFLPADIDENHLRAVPPGTRASGPHIHYLGTDPIGRDLLAGLIHGTRISLSVGIIASGISALIGIFLGAMAGYFGDYRLMLTRGRLLGVLLGTFLGFFYGFFLRADLLGEALASHLGLFFIELLLSLLIFVGLVWGGYQLGRPLDRFRWFRKKGFIAADLLISRLIELMVSMPILILIIAIAAIASPSLALIMLVIGLTSWTRIARLLRGEMLKVRNLEYIQAAQAQGLSDFRVILRHALPNAISPVLVAIAFGIAGAILIESSLSFLGIGVPVTTITWGKLLNAARENASAWWLAVFPGLAIFLTVTCFNLLGEGLRDALDPRLNTFSASRAWASNRRSFS